MAFAAALERAGMTRYAEGMRKASAIFRAGEQATSKASSTSQDPLATPPKRKRGRPPLQVPTAQADTHLVASQSALPDGSTPDPPSPPRTTSIPMASPLEQALQDAQQRIACIE
eukprot:3268365-Amphidinium_carterae.1